jgi:hypothetical protein
MNLHNNEAGRKVLTDSLILSIEIGFKWKAVRKNNDQMKRNRKV